MSIQVIQGIQTQINQYLDEAKIGAMTSRVKNLLKGAKLQIELANIDNGRKSQLRKEVFSTLNKAKGHLVNRPEVPLEQHGLETKLFMKIAKLRWRLNPEGSTPPELFIAELDFNRKIYEIDRKRDQSHTHLLKAHYVGDLCQLAMGYARAGDTNEATRLFEQAKQYNGEAQLLEYRQGVCAIAKSQRKAGFQDEAIETLKSEMSQIPRFNEVDPEIRKCSLSLCSKFIYVAAALSVLAIGVLITAQKESI